MEKTKKAYEIVIDSIKEQIMNQELVLGQGLPPEREISEKIGVSRNSVREALKILTVMGVVLVYEIRRYAQSDYNCCSLPVQHCDAVHDSVSVGT